MLSEAERAYLQRMPAHSDVSGQSILEKLDKFAKQAAALKQGLERLKDHPATPGTIAAKAGVILAGAAQESEGRVG